MGPVADMVPSNEVRVVVSDAPLAVPVRKVAHCPCAPKGFLLIRPTGTFPRREGKKTPTSRGALVSILVAQIETSIGHRRKGIGGAPLTGAPRGRSHELGRSKILRG